MYSICGKIELHYRVSGKDNKQDKNRIQLKLSLTTITEQRKHLRSEINSIENIYTNFKDKFKSNKFKQSREANDSLSVSVEAPSAHLICL